jgi:transketolase
MEQLKIRVLDTVGVAIAALVAHQDIGAHHVLAQHGDLPAEVRGGGLGSRNYSRARPGSCARCAGRAKATKGRPQGILARTIKGHGVSFLAGKEHWHGKPIPKDQLAAAIKEVGEPIDMPADRGKSYARTTLPEPPDFPAPAAPDYDPAKPVATREAYGFALKRLGAVNPHVVAISGDVKNSTFSEIFQDAYPNHFYQGYIAEQNLVSAGVGLAARGKVPFLDTFACFLARAYDQVRMAAISRSNARAPGLAQRTLPERVMPIAIIVEKLRRLPALAGCRHRGIRL